MQYIHPCGSVFCGKRKPQRLSKVFIDFLLSVLKVVTRPFNTKRKKAGFVASKN